MVRILIEGSHGDLAKEIRKIMNLPLYEPKVVKDARQEMAVSVPMVLIFDYYGYNGSEWTKALLQQCGARNIPFIALVARARRHTDRLAKIILVREALKKGALGVFDPDCHKSPFCVEELVRRIKMALAKA
jgi:CheY-like chemotaxis protein